MYKIYFFVLGFFYVSLASAAGMGEDIFAKRCALCHYAKQEGNRIGPSLHKIIGRPAASIDSYNYSDAMKKARSAGLVWTEEKLKNFLRDPHKMIPGTKMPILFMKNETDLNNLISYLLQTAKE